MVDSQSPAANPVVLIGAIVITLAIGIVLLMGSWDQVLWIQAAMPLVVGTGMMLYGCHIHDEIGRLSQRTIIRWFGIGVLAFFVVGFWFGQLSRRFDTSFEFAIFGSLVTGGALGCLVGIYAARLQRANAELKQQSQRMSDFASIVSHDLRNPISVVSGQIALLDADEDRIETIQQSLERMDRIINGVLTLTRERNDIEVEESVDLETTAMQAWQTVETDAGTLEIDGSATLAAEPDLLAELLENLFRNSLEHGLPEDSAETDGGQSPGSEGSPPAVTVRVGDCSDGFYFADDGPGIPPERREQIFETGYTTNDGSGLGLMIVSRIARAHDWSISVTESADGGAKFVVSL